MKRLFIAVKIDESEKLISVVTDLRKKLEKERIAWVKSADMHITLAFLGDSRNDSVEKIETLLVEAAAPAKPFSIDFTGVSHFSKRGEPRVIYIKAGNCPEIEALRNRLVRLLSEAGLFTDSKPFKAHATAGRVKKITDKELIRKSIASHSDTFIQKQKVNSIILYESILTQPGPVYKILKEVLLK